MFFISKPSLRQTWKIFQCLSPFPYGKYKRWLSLGGRILGFLFSLLSSLCFSLLLKILFFFLILIISTRLFNQKKEFLIFPWKTKCYAGSYSSISKSSCWVRSLQALASDLWNGYKQWRKWLELIILGWRGSGKACEPGPRCPFQTWELVWEGLWQFLCQQVLFQQEPTPPDFSRNQPPLLRWGLWIPVHLGWFLP